MEDDESVTHEEDSGNRDGCGAMLCLVIAGGLARSFVAWDARCRNLR